MLGETPFTDTDYANGHINETVPPFAEATKVTPRKIADRVSGNVRNMPISSLILSGLAGIGLYALFTVSVHLLRDRPATY